MADVREKSLGWRGAQLKPFAKICTHLGASHIPHMLGHQYILWHMFMCYGMDRELEKLEGKFWL